MMDFLKNFLSGEKSAEEKKLMFAQEKTRDVMKLDGGQAAGEEDCDDDYKAPSGGCCGGGCRQ